MITITGNNGNSNFAAGQVINIGSGKSVSIASLARRIAALTGNVQNLRIGMLPYRTGEIMSYTVDIAKAQTLLGWTPRVGLDEGLAETIAALRAER